MHALTTVSCIGTSMRTCRVIRTAALVNTRGIPVVARTWMTSRPRFLRIRKKRATCRGKVLISVWYLPVIDHLLALFENPEDAKLMSWHASAGHIKDDGKLRHPSDGKQWKSFNAKFTKDFGDEARNVRFALSTDGMNPFGDLSSSHSTWPVILTIYNLPPYLCLKCRYIFY